MPLFVLHNYTYDSMVCNITPVVVNVIISSFDAMNTIWKLDQVNAMTNLSLCAHTLSIITSHGPLTRYVKLRVAHAPEFRERFPATYFKGNS